jgi:hypothetical protein
MLTVVAILLLLWLYGLMTIGLFGNMIHLLLIVALVALVYYTAVTGEIELASSSNRVELIRTRLVQACIRI